MLTRSKAYDLASSWGSYVRAGDPGAVFYAFRPGDARPNDEGHRRACLAYVAGLIRQGVSDTAARELKALRTFFQNTGLRA